MRRAIIYLFYDASGVVDEYVLHTLGHLRKHAETIIVVSNGDLDDAASGRLRAVSDQVLVRETATMADLGWAPAVMVDEGVRQLCAWIDGRLD